MGYRRLFYCFRARDDRSTIDSVSQPSSRVKPIRGHDSKNRLSDLFLCQENVASSPGSGFDSMHIDKDHKDEARCLKPCGTTPATQIETRKATEKLETPQSAKHYRSSQFHSSVFHLDEKTDQSFEEVSEETPNSCLTDARNHARISTGFSEESQESIGNIKGKIKSVRFEFEDDQTYSSSFSKSEMTGTTNVLATSSRPTSVKLSDEIHTPGTTFLANTESAVMGRPKISSQSASLSKLLEDSESEQQANKEKTETESTTSVTLKLEESSDEKYQIGETSSLSSKVKQSQEKRDTNIPITSWDKPIIGMVAAHWNDKDQSQISPKWWDGNGIPNSTNKYKEDQIVSWHATSFEERLEQALSEESCQSFISSRKKFGIIEETEKDTAISKLQHSPRFVLNIV